MDSPSFRDGRAGGGSADSLSGAAYYYSSSWNERENYYSYNYDSSLPASLVPPQHWVVSANDDGGDQGT